MNSRFQAARLRTRSRADPSHGLSRAELAGLVHQWVLDRTGRETGIDEVYVGKLERGVVRWPNRDYRDALRAILGAGSDSELGFSRTHSAGIEEDKCKGALLMAEDRARRFTQTFGGVGLSDEAIEQAYDDVAHLVHGYQREPLAVLLGNLTNAQEVVFSFLEEHQRPSHARHLFFLGGIVSGLLAKACHDHTNPQSAMTHARTAFLCADQSDHNGLRAWIRGLQSQIAYWAGRPRDALRYAQSGAEFAATAGSTMSVWLPASEARAWALLGNEDEVVDAIHRAESALDTCRQDELDELGGLCRFGPARQRYYAADALSWLPAQAALAERYARQAVEAYEDRDSTEWAFGDQAGSRANLAIALTGQGEAEAVAEELRPLLDLPPELRINGVVSSAQRVHVALRQSTIAVATGSLQEEIELFSRTPLPALPPGAG